MDDEADELDEVFAALANKRRRRILLTLALQPASIGQLAEQQGLSLPAIHKHIAVLEGAGLVQRKKSGRVNFLALKRPALRRTQEWMHQFHAYWGNDQESLDNYVAAIEKDDEKRNNK